MKNKLSKQAKQSLKKYIKYMRSKGYSNEEIADDLVDRVRLDILTFETQLKAIREKKPFDTENNTSH